MNSPYRESTEPKPTAEELEDERLTMFFGSVRINGEWKPILKRYKGRNKCKKCNGFGTYGNPLCGALYTCSHCNGSGIKTKTTVKSIELKTTQITKSIFQSLIDLAPWFLVLLVLSVPTALTMLLIYLNQQ